MNQIDKHLNLLFDYFYLIRDVLIMDDEERHWKLTHLKNRINFIKVEMGEDPLKFKRGTWEIICQ